MNLTIQGTHRHTLMYSEAEAVGSDTSLPALVTSKMDENL